MNPQTWSYGDVDGQAEDDALTVRDRTYESFGEQGFGMADHAPPGTATGRGVASVDLGAPVEGSSGRREADERLKREITTLLEGEAEVELVAHGGSVALSGTVRDEAARQRLLARIGQAPGVVDVVDRLRVTGH